MAGDVRLVGIQAPKLPLGRKNFQEWPLAKDARAALVDLVEGRKVTLHLPTTAQDRNTRTLAHIMRDDGLWVQGEMLRAGFARVYSFPDNRLFVKGMLEIEQGARLARRGIWANEFYALRDGTDVTRLEKDVGTFQIVNGVVMDAAKVGGRVYLNFGADYQTDFTVSIGREGQVLFATAGFDPLTLQGKRIQVRGWVAHRNGPSIELTHPEQIEMLD